MRCGFQKVPIFGLQGDAFFPLEAFKNDSFVRAKSVLLFIESAFLLIPDLGHQIENFN